MPRKPLPPAERLLSVYEVAELVGAHHATIRRWIEAGRLRAVRLPGGQLRVDQRDLTAVMSPVLPTRASLRRRAPEHDDDEVTAA
jgi:excisionase family DNA binding protein